MLTLRSDEESEDIGDVCARHRKTERATGSYREEGRGLPALQQIGDRFRRHADGRELLSTHSILDSRDSDIEKSINIRGVCATDVDVIFISAQRIPPARPFGQ